VIPVLGYFGSSGAFQIDFKQIRPPDNDDCESATMLAVEGPRIPGDTADSTSEFDLEVCGGAGLGSEGGLWYKFQGNDTRLLLGVDSVFDSQLMLYTGSCDSLECVAGNDDSILSAYQSSLDFDSVDGATYYVLGKMRTTKLHFSVSIQEQRSLDVLSVLIVALLTRLLFLFSSWFSQQCWLL
jgi:hypothetical protein